MSIHDAIDYSDGSKERAVSARKGEQIVDEKYGTYNVLSPTAKDISSRASEIYVKRLFDRIFTAYTSEALSQL